MKNFINKIKLKIQNIMTSEQFKNYCNRQDYSYEIVDDRIIVTYRYNFSLGNFKKLPNNVTFRNNGYVNLPNVEEINDTTLFENSGDVHMINNIVIPDNYKGFKNSGNIFPENIKFKTPNIKFYVSEEISLFCDDNRGNKYVDQLRNLVDNYLKKNSEQVTMMDFNGADEVTFLPIKNIIKLYKKALVDNPNLQNRGIDTWVNNNRTLLFGEAKKNVVKVGRFIAKLFPDITDVEKEEFVTLYKSFKTDNDYEFETIKGDDIITAYCKDNQDTKQGTTLSNSCMNWKNDDDKHPYNHRLIKKMLEFYSKNENCELLVLRLKNAKTEKSIKKIVVEQDPDNPIKLKKDGTPDKRYKNHTNAVLKEEITETTFKKIKGRALIWHDYERDIHYMEHIYATKASEDIMFANYAKERNWVTYNNKYEDDKNKLYKKIKIPVPKEIADKGRISDCEDLPTYLDSLYYDDNKKVVYGN